MQCLINVGNKMNAVLLYPQNEVQAQFLHDAEKKGIEMMQIPMSILEGISDSMFVAEMEQIRAKAEYASRDEVMATLNKIIAGE